MKKILKLLTSLAFISITFAVAQMTQCMDQKTREKPFGNLLLFKEIPEKNINVDILKYIAAVPLTNMTRIGKLRVVCKEWQSFIEEHKTDAFKFAIQERLPDCRKDYDGVFYEKASEWFLSDPEACERFLNGRLIYKPNTNNDIDKVELRIADLTNPLEGTFDLSRCRDTGEHLSISTGYRKRKKPENFLKIEIWLAPRSLVEKEINESASHFKAVLFSTRWLTSAPVGMFWTWGGWDDIGWYDYLTTESMNNLSKIDLFKNYDKSRVGGLGRAPGLMQNIRWACPFMFIL